MHEQTIIEMILTCGLCEFAQWVYMTAPAAGQEVEE